MSLANKIFRTKMIQKNQKKKKLQLQFRYAPLKSYKAAFIKLQSFSSEMAVPFTRKSTVRTFR